MGFEFHENVLLAVPDVKKQYSPFKESLDHRENNKLIVEIAAIHAGLTSNFNMYTQEALETSLSSWVNPFPRPIILNHNTETESIGRIMASKLMTEVDGTHYVRLQAAITDPLAIERILDERYLTGSVGGAAKVAKCSVCETDWAAAEMSGQKSLPCRHRRGSVYEGKLAYFELADLKFKEYSFVNVPADEYSGVRAKVTDTTAEDNDNWSHTVKMYSLNMNTPAVVEMSESEGHNLLDDLTKKEAKSIYMNLKGTFLTVSAYDYKENENENGNSKPTPTTIINDLVTKNDIMTSSQFDENFKEKKMAKAAVELKDEKDDDILNVVTDLATDLASVESDEDPADASPEDEDAENSSDEEVSAESDEPSDNSDPEADPENEEADSEEEEEVTASDEEQLVDTDEPEPEDDGTEEPVVEPAEEAEVTSEKEKPEAQEDEGTDLKDNPTRNITDVEEENKKLKKALHTMLAEKVVDAKIARGQANATDRATLVEEHASRTASSLGDTLKDLARIPVKTAEVVVPKVEEKTMVATEENVVIDTEDEAEEPDPRETITENELWENLMFGLMNNKIKYTSAE